VDLERQNNVAITIVADPTLAPPRRLSSFMNHEHTSMILPVILSGGSGTRLWPLSRELYPKQLLALTGRHTLLQQTALRVQGMGGATAPLVICNEEHRFMVAEQLREVGVKPAAIILEPLGRNTRAGRGRGRPLGKERRSGRRPAAGAARRPPHRHEEVFRGAVQEALVHAGKGRLVTFGIVPHAPETGYGYIRHGKTMTVGRNGITGSRPLPSRVRGKTRARHRPKLCGLRAVLLELRMFLLGAAQYLQELGDFSPDMVRASEAASPRRCATSISCASTGNIRLLPSDSIDYAVMEKTKNGVVIPMDRAGTTSAPGPLSGTLEQGRSGNVTLGMS